MQQKGKGGAFRRPRALSPLDPSALDAGRAGLDPRRDAVDQDPGGLKVGLPDVFGVSGGMAYPVSHRGLLSAYITFPGHCSLLVGLRKRRQHIPETTGEIKP